VGQRVAPFGGLVCGVCRYCRVGKENFCDEVAGIRGFHVDGFAAERVNHPARLMVAVPPAVPATQAACVPVTFATVEHMLVDNAQMRTGETVLVQAAGSGVGSAAISLAKSFGCHVIATAGSPEKWGRGRAHRGAPPAIDYREIRVEAEVRRLTGGQGVDIVFEHVGADTWPSSLLSLAKGGRLVTCGSTTGMSASTNLFLVFQRQLRIIGSFGAPLAAIGRALGRMADGSVTATIDCELALSDLGSAVARLERREVFGKIVLRV
jgi:alcohol dehydrogenase